MARLAIVRGCSKCPHYRERMGGAIHFCDRIPRTLEREEVITVGGPPEDCPLPEAEEEG